METEAARVRRRARQLNSAQEVQGAIARMAAKAASVLADKDPVVLTVLHGGVFTAVGLTAHFEFPYRMDFVHASRYGDHLTGGALEWRVPPSPELTGRTVLAVDDVLDRGVTLRALRVELECIGVAALYTAVLVSKRLAQPIERPRVDFVGLNVEDVYVFGCGMDYKGYWRGLPALYTADGE